MEMNDGGHMHGMAEGGGASMPHRHMMMHMTFFWGKNTEILFHGWPGYDRLGMYVLALVVVFFFAVAVEWLSHFNILRRDDSSTCSRSAAALLKSLLYVLKIGLAYLVMLAVMSFNAGVFLAAIAGHGVGFFFFGSKSFDKRTADVAEDSGKICPP